MHGVFFHFLKEFMQERYGGKDAWESLLIANGYAYKVYFPVKEYPDTELTSLIDKAGMLLDIPTERLMEDFGEFLAPRLLQFYSMYIKDRKLSSLELLQNLSTEIRPAIQRRNPDTNPPEITTSELGKHHIQLYYNSPRRLCVIVRGMLRGIGNHYNETLEFNETECMHQGASECVFDIQRKGK
jgi:hypothetical protein